MAGTASSSTGACSAAVSSAPGSALLMVRKKEEIVSDESTLAKYPSSWFSASQSSSVGTVISLLN